MKRKYKSCLYCYALTPDGCALSYKIRLELGKYFYSGDVYTHVADIKPVMPCEKPGSLKRLKMLQKEIER